VGELSQKIVIERIDEVSDVRIFPLKYAWAYNMSITAKDGNIMIPGVATLLQQLLVSKQQGGEGAAVPVFNLSTDKTRAQPHKELVEGRVSGTKPSSSSPADDTATSPTAEAVGGQNIHVEDTLISFDARLNAVIIKGKKQNMPFFERVIQELDVPCRVIRIDVAIVDIDQKAAQEFGTDLLKIYDKPEKRVFSFSPKGAFTDAAGLTSNLRLPLNSVFRKFNVETYLQALEESGNAQTLARPSVLTIDNIGATIDRSNTFYVKVSGTKTEGLYDVSASTKLRVVPHIVPGEFNEAGQAKIKLFVEVADGSVSQKTDINAGTPTTDSNMINTQAVLYEGQSLVIGGYFHETHSTAESGFPLLRHIPILGYLFKFQESKKEVRERIYVITPRIVDIDGDPDADTRRFFQKGNLRGEATLSSNAFALTEEAGSPEKEWLFTSKEKAAVPGSSEPRRPLKRRRVRRW
jgi:type III secretion protein C